MPRYNPGVLSAVWIMAAMAVLGLAWPAQAQEMAWVRTEKIAAFEGRFGYEAYADRVVVIDNANGAREAVRSGAQSTVGGSFSDTFAGDATLSGRLGPAISMVAVKGRTIIFADERG